MHSLISKQKVKRIIGMVLLASVLLLQVRGTAQASTSRYAQSGSFTAIGSPLLNPKFTLDQWNKWEMAAWGVFLSNFVVPMADSYESAFSTNSKLGSKGSGFKALDFSQAGDTEDKEILKTFLQFAIDNAKSIQKDLYVSYYYVDQAGSIIEPLNASDKDSAAIVIDDAKNPTLADIQPEAVGPANFTSLLPYNLADSDSTKKTELLTNEVSAWITGSEFGSDEFDDVFGVSALLYRPWINTDTWTDKDTWSYSGLIAIPPAVDDSLNYDTTSLFTIKDPDEYPEAYAAKEGNVKSVNDIAIAKLPIIWLKGADGTYEKVWDMLDPWDYQVLIAMLAKELNSDAAVDTTLTTEKIWETVADNINKAFDSKSSLKMDCFGNITTIIEGNPVVVIPAAYNKHLTTTPMVNLVNSLFLTGPTSGVSSQVLLDKSKMPVRSKWWWINDDNETSKDYASLFGPGMSAFGWRGASMPNNAVSIYFDSDTLAYMTYKDRVVHASEKDYYKSAIEYEGVKIQPHVAAILGVTDLSLNGNRKFERNGASDVVVPRLTLTGISKAAGLGSDASEAITKAGKGKQEGVKSLMTALTFQEGIIGLLPASYNEVDTEYVSQMLWQNKKVDLLGDAKVIPVAMQSGSKDGKMLWSGLARSFVSYYGTEYYANPNNKRKELERLSKLLAGEDGTKKQKGNDIFVDMTQYLMYDDDNKPTLALIQHSKQADVASYMDIPQLGTTTTYLGLPHWADWLESTGFVWKESKYIKDDSVDTSWFSKAKSEICKTAFASMTQRWIKAYPTNKVLTSVASYLGMRGDSEFSAAAAPYVYMTYLNIYGVCSEDGDAGVFASTLNKNPTKFNDNIFDAKGSPIFTFNISENVEVLSDEDKTREINNYVHELLSPTGGHEYKRQLLTNITGNFVYDQYTKTVYGGALEYRSGGVQQVVTRSQTGFLRFPSLEDNFFTRWFYSDYATVAIILLAIGIVFILIMGIFRNRKLSWFGISITMLVISVVTIPFVNDLASSVMDSLVSDILKDKTTTWSLTEYIANSNIEDDYMSTDLTSEEAELAAELTKSMSIVYTDRSLMLKQDISHKVISLGNFSVYQKFASTRWMLPSILRQFTSEDASRGFLYVPLLDVADDAANAYWWYNPADAYNSGGIAASDMQAKYAVGTQEGTVRTEYTYKTIKKFYPNYHWLDTSKVYDTTGALLAEPDKEIKSKLSYRSISQSVVGTKKKVVPIHDYIYMYMNNAYESKTQQVPVLAVYKRPKVTETNATNKALWGDSSQRGYGTGSYLANFTAFKSSAALLDSHTVLGHGQVVDSTEADGSDVATTVSTLTYDKANLELFQMAQKYVRDERDTMCGEFAYLWSTETVYPYFYALVKDTMDAVGRFDYSTGLVDNTVTENAWNSESNRLSLIGSALIGLTSKLNVSSATNQDINAFFDAKRTNFMYQSGVTGADLYATYPNALLPTTASTSTQPVFTGYSRDVLDLESMFYNVIPYMYEMTMITGGLTGDGQDTGLFGDLATHAITDSMYRTYSGLPQSWLYRCNWATKIVEAPAYNKEETIGYFVGDKKEYAKVTMTYLPDAYHAVPDGGRDMIFSEAQFRMSGLDENDLTTLELKLIKLNKEISKKWTKMLNYINANGMTAEVMCRQMALDAMLAFNSSITPTRFGNTVYALAPANVDLRSVSFDTIMRVLLLNTTKDTNFFGTDAMESTIVEFGMGTGWILLITAWISVYGVTLVRAFLLAFLFFMGIYGVARGVFAPNARKTVVLFGYLVNIGLLFILSFIYYEVFNILMLGSNSNEYISSGVSGATKSPTIAILVVFVAGCVYIFYMIKMFLVVVRSFVSGVHDLGYGTYKDKVQAKISKLSNRIDSIRDIYNSSTVTQSSSLNNTSSNAMSGVSATTVNRVQGSASKNSNNLKSAKKRNLSSGSGSKTVTEPTNKNKKRKQTNLDDYESIDAAIARSDKR